MYHWIIYSAARMIRSGIPNRNSEISPPLFEAALRAVSFLGNASPLQRDSPSLSETTTLSARHHISATSQSHVCHTSAASLLHFPAPSSSVLTFPAHLPLAASSHISPLPLAPVCLCSPISPPSSIAVPSSLKVLVSRPCNPSISSFRELVNPFLRPFFAFRKLSG